ncbi:neuronal acetylcholine receptor subunit alpha-10-like [Gigantopelta aegis]|uniref:neuronal acetylcholine receptor subunit alpha-10-like n=1 Tax=Gigantopelta aegis TaxID=1735272 RepID=UPI001B887901|nr:neuronal acetylcholine receptor subunit alpha-10-like [Gigantopelta aegis]
MWSCIVVLEDDIFCVDERYGVTPENFVAATLGCCGNKNTRVVEIQVVNPPGDADPNVRIPDEQKLLYHLMRGYEKSVRPVRNASSPVNIRMGLTLTQILDMDEKNQVLVTNVWLDQEWDDEFLVWEPENFNNITMIRIPCHKLWLPDIVLYNNAAGYTDGLMAANAMVGSNGNVFWPVPAKLQSSCKVDVTYFPFDIQKCRLKFGSWTYDGFQVDILNRTSEVDISNYVNNGEWDLISISIVRNVVFYACCEEPFPDVTFFIVIQRRTLYYMYNVVFPCVMMSALTLMVFCLPPDSGEKIALGITVLLAFSVFMLAVAENLPETSEFVPLISIYLTIVMALTSLSVIMTVFVLNLHHRGPDKRAIPSTIRKLMFGSNSSPSAFRQRNDRYRSAEGNFIRNLSLKMTLENIAHELRDERNRENGVPETLPNDTHAHTLQGPEKEIRHVFTSPDYSHQKHMNSRGRNNPRSYEDVLLSLTRILDKHENEEKDYEIMQEWRRLAQTVDRILFFIFLFGTVISTFAVLVIAPATQ